MDLCRVVIYRCLQLLFWSIGRVLFRLKVVGADNIPVNGGLLIASNHASLIDIPIIGCCMSRMPYFLGKVEVFGLGPVGTILKWLGGISIHRGRGDKGAIDAVVERLTTGGVVVFYPEGTRSAGPKLGRPKPGLGMVVSRSGVPVVPAYMHGTWDILPKGSLWPRCAVVTVVFGEPVSFDLSREEAKESYRMISEDVMERIKGLRDKLVCEER